MKNHRLSSRTYRLKELTPRSSPYFQSIRPGRMLGYLRGKRAPAGYWYVSYKPSPEAYPVRKSFKKLGWPNYLADDQPEGKNPAWAITFEEAFEIARDFDPTTAALAPKGLSLDMVRTVNDAVDHWLKSKRVQADSKGTPEAERAYGTLESSVNVHIRPMLGELEITQLNTPFLRDNWLPSVAMAPRNYDGEKRRPKSHKEKNARRSNANLVRDRFITIMNHAMRDDLLHADARDNVWKNLPRLKVNKAPSDRLNRLKVPSRDDVKRLLNGTKVDDPDLNSLITGAIYTGCRVKELVRLTVGDCHVHDPDGLAFLEVLVTKTGRPRNVYLNGEGRAWFAGHTAQLKADDLVFTKNGKAWTPSQHEYWLDKANKANNVPSGGIVFHSFRHFYATEYLEKVGEGTGYRENGLLELSRQLGHSSTKQCEQNYAHLKDSYRQEHAQQHAPTLGIEAPDKVRKINLSKKQKTA